MKKELLFGIGGFLAVLFIGYMILMFSASSDAIKVDGHDAIRIAWAHTGYKVALIVGAIVCFIITGVAIKKQIYGVQVLLVAGLCAVIFGCCLFILPVNIKTDPISGGATTEEIQYLRTRGLK